MTIAEEIEDTKDKDPSESIGIGVSMTRGLFLHALMACRDGDYGSISSYISDLIRRDKQSKNKKQEPG